MGAVLVRSLMFAEKAEHIPVHLGAMPDAVAAVAAHGPDRDEVWILNDPFAGGTHLPDVTMVSRTALGFAVSRAHHADVGAAEPGSMPAESRTLEEEGVVIPPTRLDDATLEGLVARMRNPEERRGDFRAQLAAHRLAEQRLDELCERRGRDAVAAAMDELYAYSERVVRAAIAELPDGRYEAEDVLEGVGGELTVRAAVTISGDAIEIDFAGTSPQHDGNLNCPLAVARTSSSAASPTPTCRRRAAPSRPSACGRPRGASSMRARRPPSPPATSRPPAASWTCCSRRSDRRSTSRRRGRGR
jgi:N-methylhydantoinase B